MAKNEERGDVWASALVKRVGLAIKAARHGRSAAWLSDRTAELGYRISPTVIAKLDSGHRGTVLGVAELLILAAALDVPPLALLFPDLPAGRVETLPGQRMSSMDAYLWATGIGRDSDPTAGARLVSAALDRIDASARMAHAEVLRAKHAGAGDVTLAAAFEAQRDDARADVLRQEAIIRECGGVLDA